MPDICGDCGCELSINIKEISDEIKEIKRGQRFVVNNIDRVLSICLKVMFEFSHDSEIANDQKLNSSEICNNENHLCINLSLKKKGANQ